MTFLLEEQAEAGVGDVSRSGNGVMFGNYE